MPVEGYLDRVGSIDKDNLEDKSLKDVKKFIKGEVDDHHETIAEKIEDQVSKICIFESIKQSWKTIQELSK